MLLALLVNQRRKVKTTMMMKIKAKATGKAGAGAKATAKAPMNKMAAKPAKKAKTYGK